MVGFQIPYYNLFSESYIINVMVEPNTLWVSLKLVLSIQMFTLKPGYKSIVSEVMKFVETPTSYGGIPPE